MKIITRDLNQISVNTYNCCAHLYEQRFMDITPYMARVDEFCLNLPTENPKILDLGCGPGNYSHYLFNKKKIKKIIGLDLSMEMVKLSKKNVPQGNFLVNDIRKITYPPGSFHGVLASFCIPYLSYNETDDLIAKISVILKPSGMLYLSCMEGTHDGLEKTSFSGELAVYMYYFSEEFLASSLEENGMQILSLHRQEYKEPNGLISTDMIIIAQKVV